MRLLLRAAAHRPVRDGVEIAASPDTPRREAWQWHVRVVDGRQGAARDDHGVAMTEPEDQRSPAEASPRRITLELPRGEDGSGVLVVASDAYAVKASAEVVITGGATTLRRDRHEVVVLVVGQGRARVEGRHSLAQLDALVLEGDDPLDVTVEREGDARTSVAVVRLESAGERAIGWVP